MKPLLGLLAVASSMAAVLTSSTPAEAQYRLERDPYDSECVARDAFGRRYACSRNEELEFRGERSRSIFPFEVGGGSQRRGGGVGCGLGIGGLICPGEEPNDYWRGWRR
jgi:hypothetical protein